MKRISNSRSQGNMHSRPKRKRCVPGKVCKRNKGAGLCNNTGCFWKRKHEETRESSGWKEGGRVTRDKAEREVRATLWKFWTLSQTHGISCIFLKNAKLWGVAITKRPTQDNRKMHTNGKKITLQIASYCHHGELRMPLSAPAPPGGWGLRPP